MSSDEYILGVSSHFHDAAAALVQGDRIIAAAQEERFSRKKGDWQFPEQAIAYCHSQISEGAVPDVVAYYEDPSLKVQRILETARRVAPRGAPLWPRLLKTVKELSTELPKQLLQVVGDAERIVFVPHHKSHAASAFYPAPFENAAVLVLDGVGEFSTTTMWSGTSQGLKPTAEITFPHSLGLLYSAFTQYCGFKVNTGEYKLMGLAPFGEPLFARQIRNTLIDLRADGSFALNMAYFGFETRSSTTSPLFELLFGQPERRPDAPITSFHMNIAASVQFVLEEVVLRLGRTALQRSGHRNLCLAGGVALNCLANSRLRTELAELEGLWIQPAAGDAGGALGAALEVAHSRRKVPVMRRTRKVDAMEGTGLGPAFTDATIHSALVTAGLSFEKIDDPATYAHDVATALADKQVVGHFDGRMEFGPRALGQRSILADPRGKETLNRVNRSIKYREDWRPFAPVVLDDKAAEYFDGPLDSPYMLFVAKLKPVHRGSGDLAQARARGLSTPMELQEAVTGVVDAVKHVDFSARLQTVSGRGTDARRIGMIVAAFDAITGCPMLLNTSFNVRGEPLVCSPVDAIECFLNTQMDVLAIGSFVVRKSKQSDWAKNSAGRKKFAAD